MGENNDIHKLSLVVLGNPSKAKVGNPGGQIPVQDDAACLDVTMYD